MTTDWKKFVEVTKDRKPNGYVVDAVRMFKLKGGKALDIGSGSGIDSKYLGQLGFDVVAFDSEPESVRVAQEITAGLPVTVSEQRIEDFNFDEDGYDLIIAWRSIPFVTKPIAKDILLKIQKHLRPGGICVLALFGPEDGWAKDRNDMAFFTVDEIKKLWPQMELVRVFEERAEGNLATGGTKFFHLINLITRKVG
ncbi:MAG: class I SAM-dependent methyltransferase [Candidatus Yanofskybacteria bacterium]|nr:class I SAM-dependent methyltransferase [Candidatus Yanofskybacteria bacterium]